MSRSIKRLQISLRLFVLVVIVIGVLLGRMTRRASLQRQACAALRQIGGGWSYDYEYDFDPLSTTSPQPKWPRWLRRAIGDEFFQEIVSVSISTDDLPPGIREDDCRRAFAALATQTCIRDLQISGGLGTDADLAFVWRLSNLDSLVIVQNSLVSDTGIESLCSLSKLWRLILDTGSITDRGLLSLSKCTELQVLELPPSSFTDRGVEALSRLKFVTKLRIGGSVDVPSKITDKGLQTLSQMEYLRSLEVSYSDITDAGLASLGKLSELRKLVLDGYRIGDEGLAHLSGSKELKVLDLRNTQVSDAGLEHLQRFPKLRYVLLEGSNVTAEGVAAFELFMANRGLPPDYYDPLDY